MFRVIKASNEVHTYRNRRNPNKYVEVKKSSDGHSYVRQYMEWDTDQGKVKNYSGAKNPKQGRYSRATQSTISQILEDYDEITSTSNIIASSIIDEFALYIDGEYNYEGVHYFAVRDLDGQYFEIGDAIEIGEEIGYHVELHSDSELWVAAPEGDRRLLTNLFS